MSNEVYQTDLMTYVKEDYSPQKDVSELGQRAEGVPTYNHNDTKLWKNCPPFLWKRKPFKPTVRWLKDDFNMA